MGIKTTIKKIIADASDLDGEKPEKVKKQPQFQKIPYEKIAKRLKESMLGGKDVIGRITLVPNYYIIYFSSMDRESREEVEDILVSELKEELFVESQALDPKKRKEDIQIELRTDASLTAGDFRIDYSMNQKESRLQQPEKVAESDMTEIEPEEPSQEIAATQPPNDEMHQSTEPLESANNLEVGETIVRPAEPAVLYQVLVTFQNDTSTFDITNTEITIGRGSKSDIRLTGAGDFISRLHAKLFYREGKLFLLPLGKNGVVLEEKLELKKEIELSDQDTFSIEDYVLKINFPEKK